jgi:PKD-like domain/Metallo-peptidase family M12/Secretion system C-terminal sorting domain
MRELIRGITIILFSAGALFVLFTPHTSWGSGRNLPGKIAEKISELNKKNVFKAETKIVTLASKMPDAEISKAVSDYTLLTINHIKTKSVINTKPEYLKMTIPVDNGARNFVLLLYKVNISPNGFTLLTSDGLSHPVSDIVHYRGSIEGDVNSVVSISFTGDEMTGLICNDNGNYVVGKIKNSTEGKHIVYNDKNMISRPNSSCEINSSIPQQYKARYNSDNSDRSVNCVNWYWETDYDVYLDKGSVANVNSFVQSIFNQVSTLYANNGISITLQTLMVWNTVDPYTGPLSGNYQLQFATNRQTGFNGDMAHLIGYGGNGGVANVGTLCTIPYYETAYSQISSSYSNVPTYSWTVYCIAHEEGHLLGSRHTHDCVWNGNNTVIDACGQAAGYPSPNCSVQPTGPIPTGTGGTIMSYCHLVSGAGINFNNGFGPQPGALILNNINNATCLSACSGCPTPAQPAAITGNASVCQASSQTYSVTTVAGATSYTWTLPSGWTGTSMTNSITTIVGSAGGTISVTANNSCGSSPARTLAVTISTIPAQPGAITGSISVCQASSQIYSVTSVPGATSYTWTLPPGWTGASATNSITATVGTASGTISVKANNACGSGTVRTKSVSVITVPAQPGAISGNTSVCAGSLQTYTISSVSGATNYTWTLPSGWTGTSTTTSITITASSSSGTISVRANNSCGTSSARTKSISILSVPNQPGTMTGNASACQSTSQVYSVGSISGATSYTWTLPSGWTGSSTTNSITATTGSNSGTISVRANNACGSGTARTKSVTVTSAPVQPGNISGNTSVSPASVQTYSISPVAGATSYSWTLQSGWTGSSTNTSITVTVGVTSGNIFVTATNNCGNSPMRSLFINMSPLPVELLSFAANRFNNNVHLDWTTASEIDNDFFTLEKSADGLTFEFLAEIDGAGNSASLLNYAFIDENPFKGVSYYRLKQTDFNGDYSYSNIVSVYFEGENKFVIYPNPASSTLTISCENNSPNKIIIYDSSGRIVMMKENISDLYQLDISILPAGYYTIIINRGTVNERQKKFIKSG